MKKMFLLCMMVMVITIYITAKHPEHSDIQSAAELTAEVMEVTEPLPTEDPSCPKFTQEEIELIAKVVYAEARGECDEGQRAVVQVVMNRVHSSSYPNTIIEVVRQKGQFVIGKTFTKKEIANVEHVLEHGFDLPPAVMYFGTWRFRKGEAIKIGNHWFMR